MARPIPLSSSHRRVGRYLICGEMAAGGMASVHLGRLLGPVGFSKIVAIKRLHEEFASDPEFLGMFIAEARLASAINHPNVVNTLDVVVENDELLLVMEYVQGETLAQLSQLSRARNAPASLGIIQRIVCDALDGLHAAHTASVGGRPLNIVHRDVSPQNIMVAVTGVARVLDFGIAQAASRRELTRPGHVKGKIAYMSPEQLQSAPLDARTDVFSAGVVLWETLTSSRLFHAANVKQTIDRLQTAVIPRPSRKNPSVPRALDDIVMKALSRERSGRYESAAEFADALRRVPGEATRAEVGAWVQRSAGDALARRLVALHELEVADVANEYEIPEPLRSSVPVTAAVTRAELPTERIDMDATVGTFTSGRTRSLAPNRVSTGRRRLVWGASIAVLASFVAIIASAASTRRPLSFRADASPASDMQPSVPSAPSPPAYDLLPVADVHALRPAVIVPAEDGLPVPVVQLDELSPIPEAAPLDPKSKPRSAWKATLKARASTPNCNPPYRIDAAGVRRVRLECL